MFNVIVKVYFIFNGSVSDFLSIYSIIIKVYMLFQKHLTARVWWDRSASFIYVFIV